MAAEAVSAGVAMAVTTAERHGKIVAAKKTTQEAQGVAQAEVDAPEATNAADTEAASEFCDCPTEKLISSVSGLQRCVATTTEERVVDTL